MASRRNGLAIFGGAVFAALKQDAGAFAGNSGGGILVSGQPRSEVRAK